MFQSEGPLLHLVLHKNRTNSCLLTQQKASTLLCRDLTSRYHTGRYSSSNKKNKKQKQKDPQLKGCIYKGDTRRCMQMRIKFNNSPTKEVQNTSPRLFQFTHHHNFAMEGRAASCGKKSKTNRLQAAGGKPFVSLPDVCATTNLMVWRWPDELTSTCITGPGAQKIRSGPSKPQERPGVARKGKHCINMWSDQNTHK